MIDTQDPSACFSSRPAGAPPRIPGTNCGQAGTEANRATVRAPSRLGKTGRARPPASEVASHGERPPGT